MVESDHTKKGIQFSNTLMEEFITSDYGHVDLTISHFALRETVHTSHNTALYSVFKLLSLDSLVTDISPIVLSLFKGKLHSFHLEAMVQF
jgi:hypothetical protein